jgi:hypothetical protein
MDSVKSPIEPEMYEEIINDFFTTKGGKQSIVNYVKVNDAEIQYLPGWGEKHLLDVIVYVKEGLLGENGLKGFGPNVAWNSFTSKLQNNKVFKKYLLLPLDIETVRKTHREDLSDYSIAFQGKMVEGFPPDENNLTESKIKIKNLLREYLKKNKNKY